MEELLATITWESIQDPLRMGLFISIIVTLFFKPLIDAISVEVWQRRHSKDLEMPEDWSARGIAVNLVTLVLAALLSWWRLHDVSVDGGDILVLTIMSAASSLTFYEFVKNIFEAANIDISHLFS